jgi:hypothetical protein
MSSCRGSMGSRYRTAKGNHVKKKNAKQPAVIALFGVAPVQLKLVDPGRLPGFRNQSDTYLVSPLNFAKNVNNRSSRNVPEVAATRRSTKIKIVDVSSPGDRWHAWPHALMVKSTRAFLFLIGPAVDRNGRCPPQPRRAGGYRAPLSRTPAGTAAPRRADFADSQTFPYYRC